MFAQAIDPDLIEPLGAFGLVVVVLVAAITWLIRDRQRIIADRDKERQRNQDLSERMVEQAERIVPVIERNAAALEQATRHMERLERDR